ncbi:hypothetical protein EV401DRAFT_1173022 [Pisolithus croceorrhizus]|nr:hypothetical protein EV401DRAFT_1173022 [Pisolithus croceorrhizus]
MITTIWLAVLPWITIWTWRLYFTMGESTAWWISGRDLQPSSSSAGLASLAVTNETVSLWANSTVIHRLMTRPFWQSLSADIFAGQIIASLIVLTFVAVFLLREWISQNARPGVFEEEELVVPPPMNAPVLEPVAVVQDLVEPDGRFNPAAPFHMGRDFAAGREEARRQARFMRARRGGMVQNGQLERLPRRQNNLERGQPLRVLPVPFPQYPPVEQPPPLPPSSSQSPDSNEPSALPGKGKARHQEDLDDNGFTGLPRRTRRKLDSQVRDGVDGSLFHDSGNSASTPSDTSVAPPTTFEFTFRAPRPINGSAYDDHGLPSERTSQTESRGLWHSDTIAPEPAPLAGYSFRPELMHDALPGSELSSYVHPKSVHQDPFSASARDEVLADSAPGPSAEESKENLDVDATAPVVLGKYAFAPSSSEPYVPIRTPSPGHEFVSSSSTSRVQAGPAFRRFPAPTTLEEGLASMPGIATYAPPEELEAGPSSAASGHMDQGKFVRQEMQDEFNRYFHEPDVPSDVLEAPHPGPDPNGLHRPAVPVEDDEEDEDGDVDLDVEDLDREDEDEDEDEFGNFNIVNRPGVQPQQAQLQEAAEQINDGVDDLEAGVEDDMEGALEAIGLRGPLFGVVQNAVLMVLVLNTAMGFGIWLPFTLGKTVALLSLDPPRAFHILHLPIRAMRVITDPMVDFVTFLLSRSVPPLFYMTLDLLFRFALFSVEKTMGPAAAVTVVELRSWVTSQSVELSERLLEWLRSPPEEPSPGLSGQIEKFFENNSAVARFLEPYFAEFGREIRLVTEQAQKSWVHLALGHGTPERTFAICLGYIVITICLAFYLNVFTVGNARSAGRAVRNAVRQQLLVVKVAMFIIIELVIFPLGCGIMLDACTIWVFPEASLASRISFFAQAPLTAMFYHWVAGTMFMYQFAILLAGCRSIMRPGAMWFIKDPQDQNFHPIRDILDRPTLTQFRKLLISAFMYSMVVACGVGSLAILLFIGSRSIFPIRWKTRFVWAPRLATDSSHSSIHSEPLSDVPIDLLFLQIVLPYTMRHLRPRKVLHDTSIYVWRYLASKLRLTSYMFGDRLADQEETVHYRTWIAFFLRSTKDAVTERDGTFRRVPASDNIALPRDMRATAEVFENGFPANEEARDLIRQQNNEAAKAKRDIKADYTVVYFPPHFRARILTFVGAVWTIVAIAVAVCIALPVQIGRRFFALFTTSELHDGYSFLVGFYLLWACYAISQASERMNKRRLRINGPKPGFVVFFAKRSLLWLSKIAYMVVMFGIVIPTLLGLVVDVYVVLPIRLTLNPTMVPNIRIVDMWCLGLIYGKIAIRLRRRIQLPNHIAQVLQMLLSNGWSNPDPQQATKELIFPLVAGLLGMLVLPAGFVYFLREIVGLSIGTKFLLVHVYPGIFAAAGLSRMCVSVMGLLSTWSQAVRDKEFLVEMRLQNHEPSKPEEEGKGDASIDQERAMQ